jgi:hypothetical protein
VGGSSWIAKVLAGVVWASGCLWLGAEVLGSWTDVTIRGVVGLAGISGISGLLGYGV